MSGRHESSRYKTHISGKGQHSWMLRFGELLTLLVTKSYLKASGETQDNVDKRILEVIQRFVATHSKTVG